MDISERINFLKIRAFDVLQELIGAKQLSDHELKLLFLFLDLHRQPRATVKEVKQFHGVKELIPGISAEARKIRKVKGKVFFSTTRNKIFASWKVIEQKGLVERVDIEKDYRENEELYPPNIESWLKRINKTHKRVIRPKTHYTHIRHPTEGPIRIYNKALRTESGKSLSWELVYFTLKEFYLGDLMVEELKELEKFYTNEARA